MEEDRRNKYLNEALINLTSPVGSIGSQHEDVLLASIARSWPIMSFAANGPETGLSEVGKTIAELAPFSGECGGVATETG